MSEFTPQRFPAAPQSQPGLPSSLWDRLPFSKKYEFIIDLTPQECAKRLSSLIYQQGFSSDFLNSRRITGEVSAISKETYNYEFRKKRLGGIATITTLDRGGLFAETGSSRTVVRGIVKMSMSWVIWFFVWPLFLLFAPTLFLPGTMLTMIGGLFFLRIAWIDFGKLHALVHDTPWKDLPPKIESRIATDSDLKQWLLRLDAEFPARTRQPKISTDLFVVDRQNVEVVKGEVRRYSIFRRSWLDWRLICYLFIFGFAVFCWIPVVSEIRYEQEGVTTNATITRVWETTETRSSNRSSYEVQMTHIAYAYQVGSQRYVSEINLDTGDWTKSLVVGNNLPIQYLRSQPETSRWPIRDMSLVIEYVVVILGAAVVLVIGLWRNYLLARHGQMLEGIVESIKGEYVRKWNIDWPFIKDWRITITYAFSTPEGITIRRKMSRLRDDMGEDNLREGAKVKVLYVSKRLFCVL